MITLITGLPGAGKTLFGLNLVKTLSEKEGRPVYYSGIDDLKLPWLELDKGEEWHQVPPGSIVFIDEGQRVFRPRGNGAAVPLHVSKLETHRHDGIDLVLITQHPMLVDSNLRRLVGQHYHVVRSFGTKKATVHEWPEVRTECDKTRSGSIRHDFFYPKESFNWYKSAELHTHKARIPKRVYFMFAIPILLAALIYYAATSWHTPGTANKVQAKNDFSASSASNSDIKPKHKTTAQFLDDRTPRIAGLAYTAPVYDDVVRPVDAPFPAACLATSAKCSCFSQQATALDVPDNICRQIVARGYFRDWENKSTKNHEGRRLAPSVERKKAQPDEAIDRYSTIPQPPPLRASDGFGFAPAPSTDKQQVKTPQAAPSAS